MKTPNWLQKHIQAGCHEHLTEGEKRRAVIVNLYAFTGIFITTFLGINAYLERDLKLAFSLVIMAAAFFILRFPLVLGSGRRSNMLSAAMLIATLMTLMIYLTISGGKANTGPLWLLIVPPVTLFLTGLKNGLIMLAVFMVIICGLLFIPNLPFMDAAYSVDFKKRLIFVFTTMTFLSALYEQSRQKTYLEVQALRKKFEYQATYDPLTQLLNRRGMIKQIKPELARVKRQNGHSSVILMDIDRFKQLNDTYGHDAGDKALKDIAALLKEGIRQQDYVARWGGEEFLLLLPDTTQENAFILAEKIRRKLAQTPIEFEQDSIQSTSSFGISQVSVKTDFNRALTLADTALYKAKQDGRNKVVIAT